ncbi:hypothetical protein DCS_01029 [Drechmeria coniospora]|uniref:Mediator of RNA polymerase II transcription subunit 12 n=1 Tax=Drechmeria coniospora TaxID=98403 RepID=A0A151GS18_DRECN|nr:hypothetical protein DCS_01029 [Drechmeria coniospora]KYK59895.1 hypothetical protein DCS_01029 [Drechmeria coniospora]
MTSRPPLGVPSRQPQRALVSTSAQHPSHQQRSLPPPYLSTSTPPARKDSQPNADVTRDAVDLVQGRRVSTPRHGASKLRLELSSELDLGSAPSVTQSPRPLTPSRGEPMAEPTDSDNASSAPSDDSDDVDSPVPMPKRRVQASHQPRSVPRVSSASAPAQAKREVRPKPYTVEVPTNAPRFPATGKADDGSDVDPFCKGLFSGQADFFPWSGNHHEDLWAPEAIQKGTWDRGYANESASARLALIPALKQKSSMNALSSIFMGILSQRRFGGQITAPSTFKPPPRVTLTDTKREMWLKDLANPTISLRRLSRTIPHGIRGRTLLDQCLNKNVPTERAVWLAKCVGANEIRAFKRKGAGGAFIMGGESKWVRDWTMFVEQFLEAVVSSFSETNWKSRVTYAIRLATTLYSAHLLDRDHYLDWILSGLENSVNSRIPMWILIAQITWADLVRTRKHSRRLAFAFLGHLRTVGRPCEKQTLAKPEHADVEVKIENDVDGDILVQLSVQLSALLRRLLKHNPESFIAPTKWLQYRDALKASFSAADAPSQRAFLAINRRNMRLLVATTTSPPAGRQYLVKLLDSTVLGQHDDTLAAKCWSTMDDKWEIVKTLVEWATSLYRPGVTKAYVAARLIKSWTRLDTSVNATPVLLDVVGSVLPGQRLQSKVIFHLVAELVRQGLFSVPHYVQWLIGRGGLHDAADVDPDDAPCASRLLVELPLHCLPENQLVQRSNLLRRAGQYSTVDESQDIRNALGCVDDTLGLSPYLGGTDAQPKRFPLRKLLRRVLSSSKAVQTAIGAHLRDVLTPDLVAKLDSASALSVFGSVRTLTEATEDFSMLSHILDVFTGTAHVDVLAACADTVSFHLDIFLALDCADNLFDALLRQLRSAHREHGSVPRPLLVALSCLSHRMPRREELTKQLERELAQSDRSNAIDACSPLSDNMTMQTQSTDGEVSEQIDKLLASGNTIDHPTMNRLFRHIVPKLELGWTKADENRKVFARLLARLRIFDSQHFDRLMADWISHIRTVKTRPKLSELYPLLVSLGCLSMSIMIRTANAGPATVGDAPLDPGASPTGAEVYLQETLHLIVVPLAKSTYLDDGETYRYQIQQKSSLSEPQSKALVHLIRNALVEYAALRRRAPAYTFLLDEVSLQDQLLETLQYLVIADSTAVAHALNVGALPSNAMVLVHKIITKLLAPGDDGTQEISFDQILGLANELTMPFCQLKLNLDLSAPLPTAPGQVSQEEKGSRFESFTKAMDNAIEARSIMWTSLLPCLGHDIARNLSSQAHLRFLALIPSLKSNTFEQDATSEHRAHLSKNLLGVIETIISGRPAPRSAQLTASLVGKLSDLWAIVSCRDEQWQQARQKVVEHWLPAFLRFITLHSVSAPMPSPNLSQVASRLPMPSKHEARARIILILCGILLELDSHPQTARGPLSQEVFDMAIYLVDSLPDDIRIQCARTILHKPGGSSSTSTTSDPRIHYLFSVPRTAPMENLRLVHREKATSAFCAMARGMGAMFGIGPVVQERITPFTLRRWEILSEPTPNIGENDTSLSLGLFATIKMR